MITFRRESLTRVLPEVQGIWRQHWDETEGYRADLGYDPDIEQFLRMDKAGQFAEFTARDTEAGNLLVGHLGFIVHKGRHTSKLSASEDYFYFRPEYRKGGCAIALVRVAVASLKAQGCTQIGMSEKLTNLIGPLLKRVGFKHVANFWIMKLES